MQETVEAFYLQSYSLVDIHEATVITRVVRPSRSSKPVAGCSDGADARAP